MVDIVTEIKYTGCQKVSTSSAILTYSFNLMFVDTNQLKKLLALTLTTVLLMFFAKKNIRRKRKVPLNRFSALEQFIFPKNKIGSVIWVAIKLKYSIDFYMLSLTTDRAETRFGNKWLQLLSNWSDFCGNI